MLSQARIKHLFQRLNDELSQLGEIGEIGLVGGAVMCLVYNARESTKDVDAIFEPTETIRRLAEKIGKDEGLPPTWLNDGAKGFIHPGFGREDVLSLSHLRVWAPEPKYMLAMKCISARWDTSDKDDVIFLIKLLKIKKAKQVFDLIEGYYPKNQILSKTQFFIEELFE
ncbi:MAG: hypothetical protein H6624_09575 [Bdellovibrionaceae bacterium]|nr:hypothetical protein [Bdellovibrionales bacterium]MCB9084585.1 hypothetical protein [Pseudobdellovibrionaceae bacterium]